MRPGTGLSGATLAPAYCETGHPVLRRTCGLASIVLLQNVLGSADAIFERKNVVHGKAELASVVERRHQNSGENALRLFFPFANPYTIMEFASYLNYLVVKIRHLNPTCLSRR